MNTVDKATKEVMNLTNYLKDVVKENLTKEKLDLTEVQLSAVSRLVDLSIEQGFQRSVTSFQKSLGRLLKEDALKQDVSSKKSK